jgi:hypothetical protein
MERSKKAWINGIFLVVTLAVNTLGAVGLINGLTQKQISDMYQTLITPSPATFSIWSVIYSLLLISVIVMIVKKDDAYYQSVLDQISGLFRVSCILNFAWIVSFSFVLVELSVVFILGFVITLALICRKLFEIRQGKRWLLPLSFGLYTGWLVIATVVNIAAALVKLKWDGFGIGNEIWAAIILIIAVLLVIAILLKIRNAAFPLPVAWAYFGIYKSVSALEGLGLLKVISLAGMAVLIGAAAIQLYQNRFAVLPAADTAKTK